MLPACIVRRADATQPQGAVLCRGATTLEANTTWARAARAFYAPTYADPAPAMRLPGLTAQGLTTLVDTAEIAATGYTAVVPGAGPFAPATVVSISPIPAHSIDCVGPNPRVKVDTYFGATDPKQNAGVLYCG